MKALFQNGNDLLSGFKRGKVFLSDSSTEDGFHESFAISWYRFIVTIELGDSFLEEHWVNLFASNRACKHRHFVKDRDKIVNDYVLDFAVFIKAKFVDSIWAEGFGENFLEFLGMGSGNENQSVLEFLIGTVKLFQAFRCVFF